MYVCASRLELKISKATPLAEALIAKKLSRDVEATAAAVNAGSTGCETSVIATKDDLTTEAPAATTAADVDADAAADDAAAAAATAADDTAAVDDAPAADDGGGGGDDDVKNAVRPIGTV